MILSRAHKKSGSIHYSRKKETNGMGTYSHFRLSNEVRMLKGICKALAFEKYPCLNVPVSFTFSKWYDLNIRSKYWRSFGLWNIIRLWENLFRASNALISMMRRHLSHKIRVLIMEYVPALTYISSKDMFSHVYRIFHAILYMFRLYATMLP